MSKLLIYFECETENFGPLMGAIGPNMAMVENLRVETATEKPQIRAIRSRKAGDIDPNSPNSIDSPDWRNYQNSKVQRTIKEYLDTCKDGAAEFGKLEKALERNGLSPNSISPALTHMRRAGILRTEGAMAYLLPVEEK